MRIQNLFPLGVVVAAAAIAGCAADNTTSTGGGLGGSTSTATGGKGTAGGAVAGNAATTGGTTGVVAATGGTINNPSSGGNAPTGGTISNAPTGGKANNVGGATSATGGSVTVSTGGSTGITQPTGGKANVGGGNPTGGGVTVSTGGSTGITQPTGGKANVGGATSATGGTPGGGGVANTGGKSSAGGSGGCVNTNTGVINEDSSGYVCNNTWGIKGAWYCYNDGSDSTTSCKGSDNKGAGAIPWNTSSSAMCLSGTMGTGTGSYAGIGFKVNSDPPGSTTTPGTWNAGSLVGFAVTLTSGASGKGTGGMILNIEYPTSTDLDTQTKDAPGITIPGVPGTGSITYNALFSDSVLANNKLQKHPVDPANLTDVKIAFFPDSVSHTYDFCIKSIVPLTTAPSPVVATGAYGPTWNNQMPQAVNGVNGYAVQSAPFPTNGNPMTMQVSATSGGVGFTYTPGGSFQAPSNGPGSFPAVISGWGPGHDGIQFYGPYKGGKQISTLSSVKSSWSFTMGSSGDAVYDVWFGNSAAPAVPGIELMIWIGNTGKSPLGNTTGAAVTGSDGVARTPHYGTANGTGEQVVSYVPSGSSTSVTNFDLLPYFKDAASHSYAGLSNSSYLLGVQTGFEVYSGNWSTTDYNITIQ